MPITANAGGRTLNKGKRLNVSEVGYQLGFTNLGHFSEVFEKYIGMKPKKWNIAPAENS